MAAVSIFMLTGLYSERAGTGFQRRGDSNTGGGERHHSSVGYGRRFFRLLVSAKLCEFGFGRQHRCGVGPIGPRERGLKGGSAVTEHARAG